MNEPKIFTHVPHPHLAHRTGPVKVADQHSTETAVQRFNARLAVRITNSVGTMWTSYVFTVLALVSLPAILVQGNLVGATTFPKWMISVSLIALVAWVAQTFLQLVLLPVIIVGQNIQASAADARSQATYDDASAALHEAGQIQEHMTAQDVELAKQTQALMAILAMYPKPPEGPR